MEQAQVRQSATRRARTMPTARLATLATLAALCGMAAPALAQPAPTPSFNLFLPITGEPGVTNAVVRDISDDGSVVAGGRVLNGGLQQGFLWSSAHGLVTTTPNGDFSGVFAVSGSGLVAVGERAPTGLEKAFEFTVAGGLVPLPAPPQGLDWRTRALGANFDASRIVGTGYSFNNTSIQTVVWNAQRQPTIIPSPVGSTGSGGRGVSDDGTVVIGTADRTLPGGTVVTSGYVWRAGQGSQYLNPIVPGAEAIRDINDLSGDGRWAVGGSVSIANGPFVATRWDTVSNTAQNLGALPGFSASWATSISDDGNVVVGTVAQGFGFTAFVWTPQSGITLLADYFQSQGVAFPDLFLGGTEFVVSGDGRTFAGNGALRRPNGEVYGGLMTITIPTPGTACVVLAGLVYGLRRRR